MKLDGKKVADSLKGVCRERIKMYTKHGLRNPRLVIIQAGDNPASNTYVKWKRKDCDEIGVEHILYKFGDDWTDGYQVTKVKQLIQELNADDHVDGILVQLPLMGLNNKMYETSILSTIAASKDVDGLRPDVFAKINVPYYNADGFYPCTPHGVILLLDYYGYDLNGMNTLVIGRSALVGRPLAQMLINRNAKVSVCHTHCSYDQVFEEMQRAKLVISAAGQPHKWNIASMANISDQPILIDVGTSVDPKTGKLVGDFYGYDLLESFADVEYVDYTPVPGGVGPMTRAALMLHVTDAYERHMMQKGEVICSTKDALPPHFKKEYERFKLS